MKKSITSILILGIIIQNFFALNLVITSSLASTKLIDPEFGSAPEIDGYINVSIKEWHKSIKETILLFPDGSQNGLSTELWVMQNGTNLYISVQFDLERHSADEFVGILISQELEEGEETFVDEDFVDAKLIHFNSTENGNFTYLDNFLNNTEFHNDTKYNGIGAATLDDLTSIYEFCLPIDNVEADNDVEDVFLEKGKTYAFRIIYGETSSYDFHNNIKLNNTVLINIKFPPSVEDELDTELILTILAIVIFCALGGLFGFYLYEILLVKKKIRRPNR